MEEKCGQCGKVLTENDVYFISDCHIPEDAGLIEKAKEKVKKFNLPMDLKNLTVHEGYLNQRKVFCNQACQAHWIIDQYKKMVESLGKYLADLE